MFHEVIGELLRMCFPFMCCGEYGYVEENAGACGGQRTNLKQFFTLLRMLSPNEPSHRAWGLFFNMGLYNV